MTLCITPDCQREALTTTSGVRFAHCAEGTVRLTVAFGDALPVTAFPANGQHSDSPRSARLGVLPPTSVSCVPRAAERPLLAGSRGSG